MKTNFKQKLSTAITAVFIISFAFFVYAEQPFDKNVFNDSDQDGLSDEEERMYGTDSFNRDSDGDGYSDGAEIKSGYDPLKAAPGDRFISPNNNPGVYAKTEISQSLDSFDSGLISFLDQKGEENVSLDELKDFVAGSIGNEIELAEKNSVLTEDEIDNVRTKKQDYAKLDEQSRKEREKEDALVYLTEVLDILIANYPGNIERAEDLNLAYQNFVSKAENLGSAKPDYEYFRTLGGKLALAQEQIKLVEVPETFLDLHLRLLELNKGFLALRDFSLPMEDSTGRLVIVSRGMSLGNGVADLLADLKQRMAELY